MRRNAREEALQKIRSDEGIKIILISFKAGSTGLNLTCCNRVILCDLWWNPQIEEQAFDRAHRYVGFLLTQTRSIQKRIYIQVIHSRYCRATNPRVTGTCLSIFVTTG